MVSLSRYLELIAAKVDDPFGRQIRHHFADNRGSSELAMLASPSAAELAQLQKAVAIMTETELANADSLGDEQIKKIADDAKIDAGIFAIFINGYVLAGKK